MSAFRPGRVLALCGALSLLTASGGCTAAESDLPPISETTMAEISQDPDLGPDQVSGLWSLRTSDQTDEANPCRIALQRTGADGLYGVYLEGCEKTMLARVAGWRVLDDRVVLVDAGGEPVLRFRLTGPERLEADEGGVTYLLVPAAMM